MDGSPCVSDVLSWRMNERRPPGRRTFVRLHRKGDYVVNIHEPPATGGGLPSEQLWQVVRWPAHTSHFLLNPGEKQAKPFFAQLAAGCCPFLSPQGSLLPTIHQHCQDSLDLCQQIDWTATLGDKAVFGRGVMTVTS